jgi:hypothetical protein
VPTSVWRRCSYHATHMAALSPCAMHQSIRSASSSWSWRAHVRASPTSSDSAGGGNGAPGWEPFYADARAALGAEEARSFASDLELSELVIRQSLLFFASYGHHEMEYVDTLRAELVNADALWRWEGDIQGTCDLRSSLASIAAATPVITGRDDCITAGPAQHSRPVLEIDVPCHSGASAVG